MAKQERAIQRSVRVNGVAYTPGQEDALAQVLAPEDAERLRGQDYLTGDWSGVKGKRGPTLPRRAGAPQGGDFAAAVAAGVAEALRAMGFTPQGGDQGGGQSGRSGNAGTTGGRTAGNGDTGAGTTGGAGDETDEPATPGEVRAPFDPEEYSLSELPRQLAQVDSTEVLGALAAVDTRKGAVEHYNARLAELEGNQRDKDNPQG